MADATRRWAGLRLALERRNYRLFVAGQLVSLIGTWTQSVAQSWLVYRLTGSAFWLGIASFCQQAPAFLFASLGGLVADRHRRRTILVVTQSSAMVLAFALATLTLRGHVTVSHVLVLAALLGAVNAVDSPTRQAFVPEMVGRENLANAVALNTTMATGASFLGPAIAGVAIKVLGEGWCFLGNGASFLAVIASLLAMRDLPPKAKGPARESLWARLHEGFRFAATHEGVRALLLLLALTALAGLPFATLMPIFASTILHGDARTLGFLMGAPGLGAVLVGFVLASRRGTSSYPLDRRRLRDVRRASRAFLAGSNSLVGDRDLDPTRRGQHDPAHCNEHAHPGHDPRRPSWSCDGDLVHDLHGLCPRRLRHRGIDHDGFGPLSRFGRGRRRVRPWCDRLCPLVVDQASLERGARAVRDRGAASGRRRARKSRGVV